MSTLNAVKSASSPQQAMLAIAEALDRIEILLVERLAEQPAADPWGAWEAESLTAGAHDSVLAARIEALEERLAAAPDEQTARALEAKLRLLKDDGGVIEQPNPGVRVSVGEDSVIELPAARPARQAARRAFAETCGLYNFIDKPLITAEEFIENYAVGGPMWMYLSDRSAVMALPREWRARMVEDIEQDSPIEASEVARDILKVPTAGDPDEVLGR